MEMDGTAGVRGAAWVRGVSGLWEIAGLQGYHISIPAVSPFSGCSRLKLGTNLSLKTYQLRSCQAPLKAKGPTFCHPCRILHFTDGCPSSLCGQSGFSSLAQESQSQVDSEHIVRSVQVVVKGKLVKVITGAPDGGRPLRG